jgi:hypothetical protein
MGAWLSSSAVIVKRETIASLPEARHDRQNGRNHTL